MSDYRKEIEKILCFFGIHKWGESYWSEIHWKNTSNYRGHNLPCKKRNCLRCGKGQWLDKGVVSKNGGWRNYGYHWGNLGVKK